MADEQSFVFMDLKGRRWRRFRLVLLLSILLLFFALILFIRSIFVLPRLHELTQLRDLSKELKAFTKAKEEVPPSRLPPAWVRAKNGSKTRQPQPRSSQHPVRLGFYVKWDPGSYRSLKRHVNDLTHVAPEMLTVTGPPLRLSAERDSRLVSLAQEEGLVLMPLLTNLQGYKYQPEAVEDLARSGEEKQNIFLAELVEKLKEIEAGGVVVDWEEVDPAYSDMLTRLLVRMKEVLKNQGLELWLCIPVGNDLKVFDLDRLADVVDRFVALLFDENGETDEPGPIASLDWFKQWLAVLLEHGDPGQWIIGIGAYGYDWKEGAAEAQTITFADAMSRANFAGEGAIKDLPPYYGPHFSYTEGVDAHTIWFLDAVTFRNQITEAQRTGGIAIHRLGTEDPQIWTAIKCGADCSPAEFETVKSTAELSSIGDGDFITVKDETADGSRTVTADASNSWGSDYISYPKHRLLFHQGARDNSVAITFDDGPDPDWTPQILDILAQKKVKAAFFVTGANAASNPDLVRRIVAEGHELGNHTYTHSNLALASAARTTFELNATQRVIESITGYSTVLFRPPYNADRRPRNYREFKALLAAGKLGYTTVSESIDTEDWGQPGAAKLVARVKKRRLEGNVILLHDAGGDRSQTVEALPAIIDYLRNRGDQLVPLHALINVPKESVMPPLTAEEPAQSRFVAKAGFAVIEGIEEMSWAFMIVSTGLVLLRTLILLVLALVNKKQEGRVPAAFESFPPVSVLMAAHNEANVICATLNSLLNSSYQGELEIIVVNDGSTDETEALVKTIALCDARIRLISQEKKGKAAALNSALRAAKHELVVMLDADTQFAPQTILHLVQPFQDQAVAAVSGHAKVGNTEKLIAKFQSLEYTCGFNLDRRAYDAWDCITVVPGAVSAFRRGAIMEAGGLPSDTLAEDTDLTLILHRENYKIRYASKALAWTEAPDTVRGLVRQRTRWAFGTLQCLWKHRDLIFNPDFRALAFFSLPSIWFYHLFLVALIPLVDLLLIVSLVTGAGVAIVDYALAFLFMDLLTALIACAMEGEKLRYALHILPMRILYRPLLAWAVWHSIIRALRGALVEWGRQERRGFFSSYIPNVGLYKNR